MKKILAALGLAAACASAVANDAIKIIVPWAPGGPADTISRLIARDMKTHTGRTVVVENKLGGGGAIGMQALLNTPTSETALIVLGTTLNFAYNPTLLDSSVRPVLDTVIYPMIMVVPANSPLKTFKDWQTKNLKKNYTYATSGKNSNSHVAGSILMSQLGKEGVDVPYTGHAKAVLDVIAGQVDFAIMHAHQIAQNIAAGQLVPIAALTDKRIPEFPNVPTMREVGVTDMHWDSRIIFLSNATNNTDDIKLIQTTMTRILNDPALNRSYLETGGQITPGNKAMATDWLQKDIRRNVEILQRYKLLNN